MSLTAQQPSHVFLDVFVECNLRCIQCDIHKLTTPDGVLSHEEQLDVVRQVSAWKPETRLVLTGGELFLRKEHLYGLLERCRELGVYTTANTNGTLIRDHDVARLPESGLNCIVVSIDSDEPEVHDRIRGVEGTFGRAVAVVEKLVAARDASDADFTVLTSTILGSHNLSRIHEMVTFFEALGVDTTLFQPIQPTFARDAEEQWWRHNSLFPGDEQLVEDAVETLVELKSDGRRLFQTERQFRDIGHYFRHPNALEAGQCASMNEHMMVDLFGDVRLCFNADRIGLAPLGNVRERSLAEIWRDARTEVIREQMRQCREGCGTMLCHARS